MSFLPLEMIPMYWRQVPASLMWVPDFSNEHRQALVNGLHLLLGGLP
jgi:hypothetical protein